MIPSVESHRIIFFLNNFLLNFQFQNNFYIDNFNTNKKKYTLTVCNEDTLIEIVVQKYAPTENLNKMIIGEHVIYSKHYAHDIKPLEYKIDEKKISIIFNVNIIDDYFYFFTGIFDANQNSEKKLNSSYSLGNEKKTDYPAADLIQDLFFNVLNNIDKTKEVFERKINNCNLILTHDVDILKVNFGSTLRMFVMVIKKIFSLKPFGLLNCFFNYLKNDHLKSLNEIHKIEKEFKSIFFVYSESTKKSIVHYLYNLLINPSYKLTGKIKEFIHQNSDCIGIHGSINSYNNSKIFKNECTALDTIKKGKTIFNRFHFLKFDFKNTPEILLNNGIKYDFSLYYNNEYGWSKAETLRPYYLFDTCSYKQYNVIEIPTVLMDSTLYNYKLGTINQSQDSIEQLINKLKEMNCLCAINFHSETFSINKEYAIIYKNIIELIRQNKINTEFQRILNNCYKKVIYEN